MQTITIERLKEVLSYDPDSGIFVWIARGRGIRTGRQAGSIDPLNGYRMIRIDGVTYLAQRLAWFWIYGTWPRLIRFQNKNRDDCSKTNLCEGFYLITKHDHKTKEGKAAFQKEYRSKFRHVHVAKERKRKFGVGIEDYERMMIAQDGRCAICKLEETAMRQGKVLTLAVDHDHKTGAVRGLLCSTCNKGLGMLGDTLERVSEAAAYLKRHSIIFGGA
jgi:hypothetical protein